MLKICKNKPNEWPNIFRYVCERYATKKEKCAMKDKIKVYSLNNFQYSLTVQDKAWAPHIICTGCEKGLHDWVNC